MSKPNISRIGDNKCGMRRTDVYEDRGGFIGPEILGTSLYLNPIFIKYEISAFVAGACFIQPEARKLGLGAIFRSRKNLAVVLNLKRFVPSSFLTTNLSAPKAKTDVTIPMETVSNRTNDILIPLFMIFPFFDNCWLLQIQISTVIRSSQPQ